MKVLLSMWIGSFFSTSPPLPRKTPMTPRRYSRVPIWNCYREDEHEPSLMLLFLPCLPDSREPKTSMHIISE